MSDTVPPEPGDPLIDDAPTREFDREWVVSELVAWTARSWAEARDYVDDVGADEAGAQVDRVIPSY